jgi:hypothetical protein
MRPLRPKRPNGTPEERPDYSGTPAIKAGASERPRPTFPGRPRQGPARKNAAASGPGPASEFGHGYSSPGRASGAGNRANAASTPASR